MIYFLGLGYIKAMENLYLILEYFNLLPTSVLAVALLGLVTLYYWPIWRINEYPPGPIPWPFIGNIPLFVWNFKNLGKYFCGKLCVGRSNIH